jgi:hypothetical protein
MPVSGEEWFAGSLGFRYDFFCRVGWFPPEIWVAGYCNHYLANVKN